VSCRTEQRTRGTQDERFRALAEAELPRLYGLARYLIGDNEAEDVVQDCLLRAYRGFGRLEDDGSGPAWLSRILVNCFRDRLRARSREPDLVELDETAEDFSLYRKIADEDPFPYSDSVHLDFLEQFGTEDVRAVLAGLPEHYRVPMVLVYMAGYQVKEAAAMVDVPMGTMLARLHRGRKLFERRLWDYAEAHGLLREEMRT
jgi:RNA polymerase sigma-70 factor, ECF subfamily